MKNKKVVKTVLIITAIIVVLSLSICYIFLSKASKDDRFTTFVMPDGCVSDGNIFDVAKLLIDEHNQNYDDYTSAVFQLLEDGMSGKYNSYNVQIGSVVTIAEDVQVRVVVNMDVQDDLAHGFVAISSDVLEYEEEYEFYRTYDGSMMKTYFYVDDLWIVKTSDPFFDNVALDVETMITNWKKQTPSYFPVINESDGQRRFAVILNASVDGKTSDIGKSLIFDYTGYNTYDILNIDPDSHTLVSFTNMHSWLDEQLITNINQETHDPFLEYLQDTRGDVHVGSYWFKFNNWGDVNISVPSYVCGNAIEVNDFSKLIVELQQLVN